ncbi:uncharacterized protein TNCT_556511 [Trichonephila clavata]|uniref:Ubiquitin-like protease family profile domain-containing protein n=1 Tax=Trichonephila clavata TaxID=2740835 RepID=A0A8X6KEZ3_TRICU|nr:uncharacterized protein TNCT_556511 [Trichonephila clavata]
MDSITLCRLACSDFLLRSEFGGVYASDELPKTLDSYSCFIVNLDPKTKPGSHWIAIAFRNNKCFYFCSYASVPNNKNILKFITDNAENLVWNKCRYQSLVSYTCGHFCLHFLYNFVRNQSLSPLESDKIENNEKFIKKFVARKFRLQNCCFSPYSNQTCEARDFRNKHV